MADHAPTLTPADPPAPAAASLTSAVGMGMAFMTMLTLSSKAMLLLTQVVLVSRLSKVEWALGGLAVSIAAFPAVLQNAGLSSVLVHRQRNFRRWSEGAASLGVLLGLIAWLAIVGAGFVVAPLYHSPDLVGLMVFVGTTVLVNSAGVVPVARLQIDLRYGTSAKIGLLTNLTLNSLAAAMAIYGLGPYACVAPQVIAAIVNVTLQWRHSGVPVQFRINTRVWRFLLADAVAIIVTNLMWAVSNYGDNIAVSTFASKETLGTYYFAYSVSYQIVQMVAGSAQPVLLPALAKLADQPERQAAAFLRGARVLATVCYPFIAALAFFIPDALHLMRWVWGTKYDDSAPIVRVLCVGMCLFLVNMSSGSLIQAQGRFRTTMYLAIFTAVEFIVVVTIGASLGGVMGVAVAVAVHHWLGGTVCIWVGVSWGGKGLLDIFGVYWAPTLACAGALLAAYVVKHWMLPADAHPAAIIAAGGVAGGVVYLGLIRMIAPTAAHDARLQLAGVFSKLLGRFARRRRRLPKSQ